MIVTNAQLHVIKSIHRFCAGQNPIYDVPEIGDNDSNDPSPTSHVVGTGKS